MTNPAEKQMVRTIALEDQVWMVAEEHYDDILRLADIGLPTSQRDLLTIRLACKVVAGGISQRRAQRELDTENPDS